MTRPETSGERRAFDRSGDTTVTSFDGTKLVVHFFPVPNLAKGHRAPTVMMGPGWGAGGDTNPEGDDFTAAGGISIHTLNRAGYNVLTWDPRGFGKSSGTIEVDHPDYEGRDAQVIVDWLAAQPEAQLDAKGDPRLGMAGGSYGGAIQLILAARDCRVDAITPTIAWHSLVTSLDKADIVKYGWASLLYRGAAGHQLDSHVESGFTAGRTNAPLPQADRDWFAAHGPGDELIGRITIPTLIVQGTVDTLFTLDEGISNYKVLRSKGVPVSMLWFCGGHGICLTKAGDETRVAKAVLAWLARYVQHKSSTKVGPRFDTVDQNGKRYTAADYPAPSDGSVTADGAGTLQLVDGGGAGPAQVPAGSGGALAGIAASITPSPAPNAVDVPITFDRKAVVVGAPKLTLSYRGTAGAGDAPTRVFAQLVDEKTGVVLGTQITPVDVTLDGAAHETTVPLEAVVFTGDPSSKVKLQLVATTTAYAKPRLGGQVQFDRIHVELPVGKVTPAR
ncbi:MAG: alpha/beta fold hydrolase [Acidimicrobiia bacterium]